VMLSRSPTTRVVLTYGAGYRKVLPRRATGIYSAGMAPPTPTGAIRVTRRLPVVRFLARTGFAVNGLLHAVIGYLAISVATGSSAQADPSGAFGQIASSPGGVFVLWALTIGLAALGVWLILGAVLIRPQDSKKRALRMAIELGKGLTYLVLAGVSLAFIRSGVAAGSGSASTPSAQLMAVPGGVVFLFLIGIIVLAVGVYFGAKGLRRAFTEDIRVPSGAAGKAVVVLGIWGYLSKGIALAIVGVLFVGAAVTADPSNATGLDGALKSLLGVPFGPPIVGIVGAGFIAYGIYCMVRAKYARL
jgi:hypothetical protein